MNQTFFFFASKCVFVSAKRAVRAHSLIDSKAAFCMYGNWSVEHSPLCEVIHQVTPCRCYLSHCTGWLDTVSFPKSYLPIGPSTGESMCAYLFYMGLSFCWYSIYSEDEWKSFFVSKHCDNDNVIMSPGMPHCSENSSSKRVSKVSAADTAQDGSWRVADGEWQRKSKGCFTRRMVLPSRGKAPTCWGVCWGEFPSFLVWWLPKERAPPCWGKPGVQTTCMQLKVASTFLLSAALAPIWTLLVICTDLGC